MGWIEELYQIAKEFGPAIGVLILSYYRDRAISNRHKAEMADLEKKFLEHKLEIEKKYAGKSSSDIINDHIPSDG